MNGLILKSVFDAKVTEMKNELPDIANIVKSNDFGTKHENYINNKWKLKTSTYCNDLVKETDFDTKVIEFENKTIILQTLYK